MLLGVPARPVLVPLLPPSPFWEKELRFRP